MPSASPFLHAGAAFAPVRQTTTRISDARRYADLDHLGKLFHEAGAGFVALRLTEM